MKFEKWETLGEFDEEVWDCIKDITEAYGRGRKKILDSSILLVESMKRLSELDFKFVSSSLPVDVHTVNKMLAIGADKRLKRIIKYLPSSIDSIFTISLLENNKLNKGKEEGLINSRVKLEDIEKYLINGEIPNNYGGKNETLAVNLLTISVTDNNVGAEVLGEIKRIFSDDERVSINAVKFEAMISESHEKRTSDANKKSVKVLKAYRNKCSVGSEIGGGGKVNILPIELEKFFEQKMSSYYGLKCSDESANKINKVLIKIGHEYTTLDYFDGRAV